MLGKEDGTTLYAQALKLQTLLYKNEILDFFKNFALWHQVRTVLDVGCGPGYFAATISNFLLEKSYTGLDIEPKFIISAKKQLANRAKSDFVCQNFFTFTGQTFDAVITWAVLQHLADTKRAVAHLKELLNTKGILVLFDSDSKNEIYAKPKIPELKSMYEQLTLIGLKKGRNDNCLIEFEQIARDFDFHIIFTRRARVPVKSKENKENFVIFQMLVSELLKRFYDVNTSQKNLLNKLLLWRDRDQSEAALNDGNWVVARLNS